MKTFKGFLEGVAYHGSPHDFDKFDITKMGTGEGNHAYGWGLYFSSNKDVSEWYRKTLIKNEDYVLVNGRALNEVTGFDNNTNSKLNSILVSNHLNLQKSLDQLSIDKRILYITPAAKVQWSMIVEFINHLIEIHAVLELANTDKKGMLYQVYLSPEDDKYLDWNLTLSEQSDYVLGMLRPLFKKLFQHGIDNVHLDVLMNEPDSPLLSLTGEELYEILTDIYKGNSKKVSMHLLSLGISGITYTGKSMERNYVVFDSDFVRITRKQ